MSGKGAKGLSGKGAKGTMGDKKGDKKKPISRSARAGLQFPVGRIHRLLKVRPIRTRTAFASTRTSINVLYPYRVESRLMDVWEQRLPCTRQQFSVRLPTCSGFSCAL